MPTQAEYFQANAVDGVLSPEHLAQMVSLPEGDSAALSAQPGAPVAEGAAEPAAKPAEAPTPEPAAAAPASESPTPQPVILAKDGVHTIEYEKLSTAREVARLATERAEAAERELAALKQQPAAPAPAAQPEGAADPAAPEGEGGLFGDFSEAALAKGVAKIVQDTVKAAVAPLEARIAPVAETQARTAQEQHLAQIYQAHPDMDSVLESTEFSKWVEAQPAFARPGIVQTLQAGTADQVNELFTTYKKAVGITSAPPAAPDAATVAAQAKAVADAAAAAIANAKTKPPTSLSEVPGGAGHVDEAAAMLDASGPSLMGKFMNMDANQVMKALEKAL